MDGWMDGWMDTWMDGWMDTWMDGWMVGWMDMWMDGWMDGAMNGGFVVLTDVSLWLVAVMIVGNPKVCRASAILGCSKKNYRQKGDYLS